MDTEMTSKGKDFSLVSTSENLLGTPARMQTSLRDSMESSEKPPTPRLLAPLPRKSLPVLGDSVRESIPFLFSSSSSTVSKIEGLIDNPSEMMRLLLNDSSKLQISQMDVLKTMQNGGHFTQYLTSLSSVVAIPLRESQTLLGKKRIFMFYKADPSGGCGSLYWSDEAGSSSTSTGEKKKFDANALPLRDIVEVYLGKHVRIFRDPGHDAPEDRCFSLIAADRMLHFEAESSSALAAWLYGICTLMKNKGGLDLMEEPLPRRKSLGGSELRSPVGVKPLKRILVGKPATATQGPSQFQVRANPRDSMVMRKSMAPKDADASLKHGHDLLALVGLLEQRKLQVSELETKCLEQQKVIEELKRRPEPLPVTTPVTPSPTLSTPISVPQSKSTPSKKPPIKWKKLLKPLKSMNKELRNFKTDMQDMLINVKTCLTDNLDTLAKATVQYDKDKQNLQAILSKEQKKRKQLLNKVIEMQGNIRVFCRVRPLNSREKEGDECAVKFPCEDALDLIQDGGQEKRFEFDRVFDISSTQSEVFRDVAPFVQSCVDGFRVCIFAYGQTGSGKTYTMEGPPNDKGVNYRALDELFALISTREQQTREYEVTISVVEIYNEQARDLLSKDAKLQKSLEIRQGPQGVYIPEITEIKVTSEAEVKDLMQYTAYPNRAVDATSMNERSSRSHCVVWVNVTGVEKGTSNKTLGKLIMIDLAGSERVKRSEATGVRLKEAQHINKSLSALGDVISALQSKAAHVPYRNSKLTYLLQDCLGGNSKCLMFCQISSANSSAQESLCSLQFAVRARNVQLGAAKKVIKSDNGEKEVKKFKEMAEEKDKAAKSQASKMEKLQLDKKHVEEKLSSRDKELQQLQQKLHALQEALKAKEKMDREKRGSTISTISNLSSLSSSSFTLPTSTSRAGLKRKAPLPKDSSTTSTTKKKMSEEKASGSESSSLNNSLNGSPHGLPDDEDKDFTNGSMESTEEEKMEEEDTEKFDVIGSPLKKSRLEDTRSSIIPTRTRTLELFKAASKQKVQSKTLKPTRGRKDQENREPNTEEVEVPTLVSDAKALKKRRNSAASVIRKPTSQTTRVTRSAVKPKPTVSRTADMAAAASRLLLPTLSSQARTRTRSGSNSDLTEELMPPPAAKEISKRHTISSGTLPRTRSQTGRLSKVGTGKGDR